MIPPDFPTFHYQIIYEHSLRKMQHIVFYSADGEDKYGGKFVSTNLLDLMDLIAIKESIVIS